MRLVLKISHALRAAIIRLHGDPVCEITPAGLSRSLLMPLSHELPSYRARFPRYDRLPSLLAKHIRDANGSLRMIDVGANIGDTIVSTDPRGGDRYIALEPHPVFYRYLVENLKSVDAVDCLQLACGEASGRMGFDTQLRGTASLKTAATAQHQVDVTTLDLVWQSRWNSGQVDFLKVDTDGFDVSVLRGAALLIAKWHPWIYYECDIRLSPEGLAGHLDVVKRLLDGGYREALVFDNFGQFACRLRLDDEEMLKRLLSRQSPTGPVFYHDVLIVPPYTDAGDLSHLLE